MNKRQERQYRLKLRRTYVFLSVCLLTALGLLIYQAHQETHILMLKKRQERIAAARREEAELLKMLNDGNRLPESKQKIIYVGGKVEPEEFARLGFKIMEQGITPLASPIYSLQETTDEQRSDWNQEERVNIDDKDTLRRYMIYRLSRCCELITWMWRSSSEIRRISGVGELITWIYRSRSEALEAAVSVAEELSMPHLYNLDKGLVSIFSAEDDVENNGGLRLRLPIIYTDLARMLLLYQNTKGDEDRYAGLHTGDPNEARGSGTQMLTGAMIETYLAAKEMVAEAEKTADEAPKDAYTMALRLHDALCASLTYMNEMHAANNENLVVEAFLNKRATSRGYARAYMLLLTLAGIENKLMIGRYSPSGVEQPGNTIPWEWNLVKIGESWVHIDVAADDQAILPAATFNQSEVERRMAEHTSHSYFAMADHQNRLTHLYDHTPDNNTDPTNDSSLYYFNHKRISILQKDNSKDDWNYVFESADKLFTVLFYNSGRGEIHEYCLTKPQEILNALQQHIEKYAHGKLSIIATEPDINGVVMIYILRNSNFDKKP